MKSLVHVGREAEIAGRQHRWPDNEVFGRVYVEHSRAIYYLALRYLCDAQRAEDATHDVFLKAFRNWGSFRGEASVRTWLYRIAINHCKNLVQSWHERHVQTAFEESLNDRPAAEDSSPLRVLETRELARRIRETLESLPLEYRLILLLVADEELSYQEVAQLTGQSADAVRGKLHRARKAFVAAFSRTQEDSTELMRGGTADVHHSGAMPHRGQDEQP